MRRSISTKCWTTLPLRRSWWMIPKRAILERLNFAESFEPYPSTKQREYPYYRIYVHNCTVFYVVIDGVMEVRRFLYSAQDIPRML